MAKERNVNPVPLSAYSKHFEYMDCAARFSNERKLMKDKMPARESDHCKPLNHKFRGNILMNDDDPPTIEI